MSSPKLFAALLLATAAVVFGAQNTQAVTFHFLVFKLPPVPLVLPVFGGVLIGALLGWVVSVPGNFRRMRQRRGLQSQVAAHDRTDAGAGGSGEAHDGQLSAVPDEPDGGNETKAVKS
jgi:uncharacterized integral membrane protein